MLIWRGVNRIKGLACTVICGRARVQELHKAAGSFCASQQLRIAALRDFMQRQRLLRKQACCARPCMPSAPRVPALT